MPEWEVYEQEIFDKFKKEFPHASIIKNHHIIGKFSLVKRQIDIAIIGNLAGYTLLGVVECKYFGRHVDVKIIESFISFLKDVGANLGIMITNSGYTAAAKNWAKVEDVRLEVLTMEEFEDFHYDYEICQLCDPGEDHSLPIIEFEHGYAIENEGIITQYDVGRCGWCNGIHVRCHVCGTTTGIYESQYNETIECDGECGLKFRVETEYIGNGMQEETVYAFFDEEDEE